MGRVAKSAEKGHALHHRVMLRPNRVEGVGAHGERHAGQTRQLTEDLNRVKPVAVQDIGPELFNSLRESRPGRSTAVGCMIFCRQIRRLVETILTSQVLHRSISVLM